MAAKTYQLWGEDQHALPKQSKEKAPLGISVPKLEAVKTQLGDARSIMERNLFHPERRAANAEETENFSQRRQAMEGLVLLGTVIDGSERYAILEIPHDARPGTGKSKRQPGSKSGTGGELRRLKLGDMLEGYRLVEVHAQKVVLEKDSHTVELMLDFSRRVVEVEKRLNATGAPRRRIKR
ncbi:MAG: hypothetical protein ACE5JU_09710 [Candidatus Binatia bacterium]